MPPASKKKPLVIVTRTLPSAIETRLMELFDTRLNPDDKPMTAAQLVDAVGDGRHQHVGQLQGFDQLRLRQRRVIYVEAGIEQFPHARFDHVGQLARNDDDRLLDAGRHGGFRCCLGSVARRTALGGDVPGARIDRSV